MAKIGSKSAKLFTQKKSNQGSGRHTKWKGKGSAVPNGGKTPKGYRKKYKGQGR